MAESGLNSKVVLVTGATYGIGAAGVVVFLASEQARWVTGQLLYVGGGHAMPL